MSMSMNTGSAGRGLLAGLIATTVLSAIMVMKASMGLMPELDPIAMIAAMSGGGTLVGWAGHFIIGTAFWGIGFAFISPYLPGPYGFRGVLFATAAWLMMMLVVLPMAGSGPFGLALGMMVPIATLMLHAGFGLVLGTVYSLLQRRTGALQRAS